ncbi:hypothetical protein KAJ02_00950 [Candidatus Bipolaricaulota bacterium]|nr:hypothetical protein [Candidatus Bipolaricaulota bacterium]
MTIAVKQLQSLEDLRKAVTLQQTVLGEQSHLTWWLPHLLHIQQSGGLLLGARETAPKVSDMFHGILIDLIAEVDGYPARRTVAWGVDPQLRNCGIGMRLRESERRSLQKLGVDLVYWDVDALSSVKLHVALNKLGGIVTACSSNGLGSSNDANTPGLVTDCVRVEWWIDSPRVTGRMEHGLPLVHQQIRLHEMDVLTKTTLLPTGVRGLIDCEQRATADHVLAEIPENLADLQERDYEAAIQWRSRSRNLIEQLFQLGYLGIGLIHEGGRSFLLFKKGTRRTELRAADKR